MPQIERPQRSPFKKLDESLAELVGGTVLRKLDVNSGFWQIPLTSESQALTTFITPPDRYNNITFGISGAPEVFKKRTLINFQG